MALPNTLRCSPQFSPDISEILTKLKKEYPDAGCSLNYHNAFELLIATLLSAQCTDQRVNQITPALFARYPNPAAFAQADLGQLEQAIFSAGCYRTKALAIQSISRQILADYDGQVPTSMAALTSLRGVGRKTASVVMGNAFGKVEGIVVDTHVARVSRRLGLSQNQQPEKIEQDLMRCIPASEWICFPHAIIAHGRAVCQARKPSCQICIFRDQCPGVE
jgi:endonuclease-3